MLRHMSTGGGKQIEWLDVIVTGEHKLVMIKHLRTKSLNRMNYQAWRTQFAVLLRGHELIDFVEKKLLLDSRIMVQSAQKSVEDGIVCSKIGQRHVRKQCAMVSGFQSD